MHQRRVANFRFAPGGVRRNVVNFTFLPRNFVSFPLHKTPLAQFLIAEEHNLPLHIGKRSLSIQFRRGEHAQHFVGKKGMAAANSDCRVGSCLRQLAVFGIVLSGISALFVFIGRGLSLFIEIYQLFR